MIELKISKNMNFTLDYEVDENNSVTDISNVWQLHEGEKYREHLNPSRKLKASLIDAIENELNK